MRLVNPVDYDGQIGLALGEYAFQARESFRGHGPSLADAATRFALEGRCYNEN